MWELNGLADKIVNQPVTKKGKTKTSSDIQPLCYDMDSDMVGIHPLYQTTTKLLVTL